MKTTPKNRFVLSRNTTLFLLAVCALGLLIAGGMQITTTDAEPAGRVLEIVRHGDIFTVRTETGTFHTKDWININTPANAEIVTRKWNGIRYLRFDNRSELYYLPGPSDVH